MKRLIKFSSQIDEKVFDIIKHMADDQGRKLHDIFNEALMDYIEKARTGKMRSHVMEAFQKSLLVHDELYRKLAE